MMMNDSGIWDSEDDNNCYVVNHPALYTTYYSGMEILVLCAKRGLTYTQALQVVALWRLWAEVYDAFKACGEDDVADSDDYPFYTSEQNLYFKALEDSEAQYDLVAEFMPDILEIHQTDIIERISRFLDTLNGYYDPPIPVWMEIRYDDPRLNYG